MWSVLIAAALLAEANSDSFKGHLVAIGGGPTTAAILERTMELAGGKSARVAIIAAADPENGPASLAQWQRMEVARVVLIDPRQPADSIRSIRDADLIWMPGGLQGVFMNSIAETGIAEAVRIRFRAGAVVGGTSAGAAVMSTKMIGGRSDLDHLRAGATPFLMDGLGLWPEVIVDQHFLQKGRFNRLALAVLDHPGLIGIGIDEQTAAIVHGKEFEVFGEGNVTVVDARQADRGNLVKGEPVGVRNLKVHLLRSGMKFQFSE